MSDPKVGNQGIRVEIQESKARQTPGTSFASALSTGLSKTADVVGSTLQAAAPAIPALAVVSAAISSVGGLRQAAGGLGAPNATVLTPAGNSGGGFGAAGGSAGAGGAGAAGPGSLQALASGGDKQAQLAMHQQGMMEMNQSFNMQYLGLQQQMQQENRQFTLLSNIMKTKHDTAKNAINNVR